MQNIGEAMEDILRRKEAIMKNSSKHSTSKPKYDCEHCKDTGTIHRIEWAESELLDRNGVPIRYEKTKIQICSCQHEKAFRSYQASSQLSEQEKEHTFQNATIDDENRRAFEIGVDFIKNIHTHRKQGTWLYIFGDEERANKLGKNAYGTGKTYLLHCIANALVHRSIPSIFITEEKLFGDIRETYNHRGESESDVLNRYYRVPILMIDDLFTAQYTEWSEGKLFSILDERRRNKKCTLITSNYAVTRVKERLPINGAKIASRIIGEAVQVEMIGRDRRLEEAMKRREGA